MLHVDEEHKLSKARLSELVERSIPSHIYILVSIVVTLFAKSLDYKIIYIFFFLQPTSQTLEE